jgi:hypothetical protein
MKNGLKRAVRLFDEREAADQLAEEKGAGHYVEHRSGEPVKCQSFCLCRDFCDFYRESVLGAGTESAGGKAAA